MSVVDRAVVIGASGLIGSHLFRVMTRRGVPGCGTRFGQEIEGLEPLDITSAGAVQRLLARERPRWVFLPAANPNVELCEADPAATRPINVEAVRRVAEAVAETDATLVYYSSDYVFDGLQGPYTEDDAPNPISEYGRQKLDAETIVRARLPARHLILRVTVVYGTESQGKNFLARLVHTLESGGTMRAPADQVGSPTLVDDIAEASWELVTAGVSGTLHLAGPDLVNRYEFACSAARVFGLNERLVQAATTAELGQKAPRPLRAGMRSERAYALLGRSLRGVHDGLTLVKEQGWR